MNSRKGMPGCLMSSWNPDQTQNEKNGYGLYKEQHLLKDIHEGKDPLELFGFKEKLTE